MFVEQNGEKYGDIDLYTPSEDWMGLQLDYTRYNVAQGDNEQYGRRFGAGGIEFRPITPNVMHVYVRDTLAEGAAHFLFTWYCVNDKTPYEHIGNIAMSAEFAWQLCHAIEEYYYREEELWMK